MANVTSQSATQAALLGAEYVSSLRPLLVFIVSQTALSALLVPLLVILLLGPHSELRRKPIYYLNILAILMGMATGALSVWLQIRSALDPLYVGSPSYSRAFLANAILAESIPIYIECILLLRLFTVYQPEWTSLKVRLIVWGPPTFLMVARVVNIIVTMRLIIRAYLTIPVLKATELSWQAAGTRVEFFLQVFDNAYMSILFLYQIRAAQKRAGALGQPSYALKLRMLFWSAACNFVFPVMLNIAQIIFVFADRDYFADVYVSMLFFVNDIVQIICAVLATLWAATNYWNISNASESPPSSEELIAKRATYIRSISSRPSHSQRYTIDEDGMAPVIDIGSSTTVHSPTTLLPIYYGQTLAI